MSVIQDFKLLNKLSPLSENKLLLRVFFLQKDIPNDIQKCCFQNFRPLTGSLDLSRDFIDFLDTLCNNLYSRYFRYVNM